MSGTNLYSNLPPSPVSNNPTVEAMDAYYSKPLAIDSTTYSMMTGFFQSRGFDVSAAETTAIALIKQAQLDGYNPINVLDSLKGLTDVSLDNIVSEILNYNRYKTSFLGNATSFTPFEPVARTIVDGNTKTPIPTYTITKSREIVNEGQQLTFLITTEYVKDDTLFYWMLSGTGITSGDITGGQLSGTTVISNSTTSVTIDLTLDSLTEGNEILVFELRKLSVSGPIVASSNITINDVSFSAVADYIVIEYTFDTGGDLDTRTRLAVPAVSNGKLYVGWGQANGVPTNNTAPPNILRWGGDNRGTGRESALFDVKYFKGLYPSTQNIVIDCRAQWYGVIGTTPVGLKITLYQGGVMQQVGYGFDNPTATSSTVLDLTLQYITLYSQSSASIGNRIATVSYNVLTGAGSINSTDTTTYA
jgi:hypothetical protein